MSPFLTLLATTAMVCLASACIAKAEWDSPGQDDPAYRCESGCPDGFECVEGVCVGFDLPDAASQDTAQQDAGVTDAGVADATVVDAIVADASSPDSAVSGFPDAAPIVQTLSFGENSDDDVNDVTADTYVEDELVNENFGASIALRMDGEPNEVSLVRFDVSSIPAGAEVLEARLVVWTRSNDPLQQGSIQVFEMLESWTEGANSGGAGVANWTQREAGTSWTTAGAGPGSRDTVILAEFAPDSNDTEWDTPLATAVVQSWVDTGVNYGLALATNPGNPRGCELHSRESGADLRRPRLVVTFRYPAD